MVTSINKSIRICRYCGHSVKPKTPFGCLTLFLLFVTKGAWIIAMWFYDKECPICGNIFTENK